MAESSPTNPPSGPASAHPAQPIQPIDALIVQFKHWIETHERKLEHARERARIPDDIPRFVTRYP